MVLGFDLGRESAGQGSVPGDQPLGNQSDFVPPPTGSYPGNWRPATSALSNTLFLFVLEMILVRRDRNNSSQLSTKAPQGRGKGFLFVHIGKKDLCLRKKQTRNPQHGLELTIFWPQLPR